MGRKDKKALGEVIEVKVMPKQSAFIASDAPDLLYSGSMGAGKTLSLGLKLLSRASRPGAREGLCRKRLVDLTASTLVTLLRGDGMMPPVLPPGRYTHNQSKRLIKIHSGGEIQYFGLDENDPAAGRSNIGSLNLTGCGIDELFELSEGDYDTVGGRCRVVVPGISNAVYGATNPSGPTHWAARRWGLVPGAKAWEGYHAIRTCAADNFHLPESYIKRLSRFAGVWKLRFVNGDWAAADGVVYDDFSPTIHIIPRFPIPEDWRKFRVIDFGFTNPTVIQWWAISPDKKMYRYREFYRTRRTVSDWADRIKEVEGREEHHRMEATVADHDAEDRATLAQAGIGTVAAQKEITVGIQAVQGMLLPGGDGKPSIYFLEDSLIEADETLRDAKRPLCTEEEFGVYVWPKDANGKPQKESPVKEHDHGMDATRYAVRYVQSNSGVWLPPTRITSQKQPSMNEAFDMSVGKAFSGGIGGVGIGNVLDGCGPDTPGGYIVLKDGRRVPCQ